MRKTRIAFLQKNWDDNMGVLWISALLKATGFMTEIWVEDKSTYGEMKGFAPDIIGFSCYTGDQRWVAAAIVRLRAAGISAKIIVGGPHTTFFPDFIKSVEVDAICIGEGEYAMLDYALALDEGKDPCGIQNLHFKIDGEIRKNGLRPLVADLDALPYPDRSYYDKYPFLARNPYKTFITSRGCPYKCTFCFNHALVDMYGNPSRYIRRRSVGNVIGELMEVKNRWGIDEVRFSDDHFALSSDWLREFSGVYAKAIGRPYTVNARADALDEEKIVCLKESGCRLVCFGIETGSEEMRNKVLKKNIKNEQIVRVAGLLKKHRIPFLTSNIIGLPNETAAEAWKTIEINQRIGTNLPWYSMMQYFPGTEIFREAREAGLIDDSYSVDDITGYFENTYLRQENIGELQNIHSFSIIVSKWKALGPMARVMARRFSPNPFFRGMFKVSYWLLTIRRANLNPVKIISGFKYYLRKALG